MIRQILPCLLLLCTALCASAEARITKNINPGWRFHHGNPAGNPQLANYDDKDWDYVSVPH